MCFFCVLQAVCSSRLERRQKLPDEGRGPDFSKSQEYAGSISNPIVGWCPGQSDMETLAQAVLRAIVRTPHIGTSASGLRVDGSRWLEQQGTQEGSAGADLGAQPANVLCSPLLCV